MGEFNLTVGGRMIPLHRGTRLKFADVPELGGQSPTADFAKVVPNPKDASVLGLENCTSITWRVKLPDGTKRTVPPRKTVRLVDGTRIRVEHVEFSLVTLPTAQRVPTAQPMPTAQPIPTAQPMPTAQAQVQIGHAQTGAGGIQPAQKKPAGRRLLMAAGAAMATVAMMALLALGVYWFVFRKSNERLVADLESTDGQSRLNAARELGRRQNAAAVPKLVEKTKDPEYAISEASVEALSKIGPPAVPKLVDALGAGEDFETIAHADRALLKMGQSAVPELIKLLGDANGDRQRSAIFALGRQREHAAPALVEGIRSNDIRVQRAALEALTKIGPSAKTASADLIGLLKHSSEEIRAGSAYALACLGMDAPEAVPSLIALLNDPSPSVRGNAIAALGEMAPAASAAAGPLQKLTSDSEPMLAEMAAEVLYEITREVKTP